MTVAVGVGSGGVGDGAWLLGVAAGVEPGPEGVGTLAVGTGFPPGRDGPAFPYPVIVTTAPAGAIATRAVQRPAGSRR